MLQNNRVFSINGKFVTVLAILQFDAQIEFWRVNLFRVSSKCLKLIEIILIPKVVEPNEEFENGLIIINSFFSVKFYCLKKPKEVLVV